MQEWLRKAVSAFPVSAWLLSLGVSYVLGGVAHDCVYGRYAEAACWAGMGFYMLPMLVAALRRHPNFRLLLLTNLFLGVTLAGWLVCFVWSCWSRLKVKHILLSFVISLVLVGIGLDAFRACARTEEAVVAEALWQVLSIVGVGAWMISALLEALRVIKNEKENKGRDER
jgi:xanthine/uracil permease